ncbi:MAG: methyltransferase domain-containing protein [Pyrinomonadaceae bacterium]
MAKTQKELAFLHDLYIQNEWTQRFADLVDKHLNLDDSDNLLYINAGTGSHALALQEKFGETTDVFATCENEDVLKIALDKAAALSSAVDFSMIRFDNDAFDTVLADCTFARTDEVETLIENAVRVARVTGDVGIFLPTSGSFGEVASLLWEVLFTEGFGVQGTAAEKIINDLPTVSVLESIAERAGLVNIETHSEIEVFEYENGDEFIASPLVADFLLPAWLDGLDENENERVVKKLAQIIDAEGESLSFRFSVKATLLTGEKK